MLLEYLLSAVVLGIVVAVPPGAVTIVACQRALQYGFRNSAIFTLGSCLSDIFYITLVYIGVANLISDNHIFKNRTLDCLWNNIDHSWNVIDKFNKKEPRNRRK